LLKLFHLDESWNSPHNRQLLQRLPDVLKVEGEIGDEGRTAFLALRTDNSVLADGHPVSRREIGAPANQIAVLAEAKPEGAVEWTRPSDITDQSLPQLDSILRERNGTYLVGMADLTLQTLPATLPKADWEKVIDRNQRAPTDLKFGSPSATVTKPSKRLGAATVPPRPAELHVKENSAPGTIVGQAVGAPDGYYYSIIRGNTGDAFTIHPKTGIITVQNSKWLDAEHVSEAILQIVATNDRNERAPVTIREYLPQHK
jgi:hypothetical protein